MFNLMSQSFAGLTCEISSQKLKEKFHIFTCPCVNLYVIWVKHSYFQGKASQFWKHLNKLLDCSKWYTCKSGWGSKLG